MATIDKLNLDIYRDYAMRITLIEQTNTQFRMDEASSIPAQLRMVDIYPRISEFDLVLGIARQSLPWAYFYPPDSFKNLRRNPFAFFRVCPSFGTLQEQAEDEALLETIFCDTPEAETQRAKIRDCLKEMGYVNTMINDIMGKVGQFLQG
jgi:hypothetical protein